MTKINDDLIYRKTLEKTVNHVTNSQKELIDASTHLYEKMLLLEADILALKRKMNDITDFMERLNEDYANATRH